MEIKKVLKGGGIYAFRNLKTGMIYFGSTDNFLRRFMEHIRAILNRKWKGISYIYNAIVKHGLDQFEYQIIDKTNKRFPIFRLILILFPTPPIRVC